jgi:hypothetical protein
LLAGASGAAAATPEATAMVATAVVPATATVILDGPRCLRGLRWRGGGLREGLRSADTGNLWSGALGGARLLTRVTLPAAGKARGQGRGAWMCRGSRRRVTRGQPSHTPGAVGHPPCPDRRVAGPGNGQNSGVTYLTEQ